MCSESESTLHTLFFSQMSSAPVKRARADEVSKFRGFGKLILFGEHFVVYHKPAFVGAVEAYTDCRVSSIFGFF
jgi:hypothetical protein